MQSPRHPAKWRPQLRATTRRPHLQRLTQFGVWYNYAFSCGTAQSTVGRFRLPPPGDQSLESLRYATFSCSNWAWGYFAAYGVAAALAENDKLDFWLHLGDFIYEYGADYYPKPQDAVRLGLEPTHEIVSLEDYRLRFSLYRADSELQRLSAAAPLISVMDDHEVANDAWVYGAKNHQPKIEGPWAERRDAAFRAYHEWMPTRVFLQEGRSKPASLGMRSFEFGNLATLLTLETRHKARTPQLADEEGAIERIEAKSCEVAIGLLWKRPVSRRPRLGRAASWRRSSEC
eukprot:TRINITY_DN9722_c0_g1_i10.p1 TRINITY_DN9722_c0_g1~~TRINITY_DN9722_c0_g1_i10.p1  ORF type:complete len:288 (+),score=41.37 TRINITY_DN9722_c0_g1_i10:325-1188(+)